MCRSEHCSPVEVISSRQQQGSAAEKNPTSKIQRSRRYLSEWDAHFCETEIALLPYNSELWQVLSTGEHCSPVEVISPRQQQGSAAKKFAPTILNLQQILSTGERCSPLQMLPIVSSAAKSLRSVLVHNSVQLCSFLTPHLNSPYLKEISLTPL